MSYDSSFDKEISITIRITKAQHTIIKELIKKDRFSNPSVSDFVRGAISKKIKELK